MCYFTIKDSYPQCLAITFAKVVLPEKNYNKYKEIL
jgi:hypothetical protein